MGKFVLTLFFLTLSIFLSGCIRAVSLPVRTVVDWTTEEKLNINSVHNLSISDTEKNTK